MAVEPPRPKALPTSLVVLTEMVEPTSPVIWSFPSTSEADTPEKLLPSFAFRSFFSSSLLE